MLTTEMHKSGRVQSRNTLQKPLFDRLFFVLALFSSIDLVQKSAAKKVLVTNGQHLARSGGRRALFSDTQNTCQPASSSENRVRPQISDSLNNPIKEHLRHTHSFALARSCAFGANNAKYYHLLISRNLYLIMKDSFNEGFPK